VFFEALDCERVRTIIGEMMPEYRDRIYPPLVVLRMFLRQVLSEDRSLKCAVAQAWAMGLIDKESSENTAAYSKARKRFPLELVHELFKAIAEEMEKRVPDRWLYRGRPVKLVDGTGIQMPDTPENRAAYPQPPSQKKGVGFPQARLVGVISLSIAAVLGIAIGPFEGKGTGEHALLREILSCLAKGDIMLADSYYPSYFLVAKLMAMGIDFVCEQHGARDTNFRMGAHLGKCDHLAKWLKPERPEWMTEEEYATVPDELTAREVRVGSKVLVTSLVNPDEFSKEDLGELFRYRWNIELDLRNIKTTLGMDALACRTPDMCEKELAVYMLAYNMIRLIMAEAAVRVRVLPRQVSFKFAVQQWLAWGQRCAALDTPEGLDILFKRIGRTVVGNRPGRVEPREMKKRPKAFPRMQTTRQKAIARIRKRGHAKKLGRSA
jgi:Transposase DDE domain